MKSSSITALTKGPGIIKEHISLQLSRGAEGTTLDTNLEFFSAGILFLFSPPFILSLLLFFLCRHYKNKRSYVTIVSDNRES